MSANSAPVCDDAAGELRETLEPIAHSCRRRGLFYGGSPLRVQTFPCGDRRLCRVQTNNHTSSHTRDVHGSRARPTFTKYFLQPCRVHDLYSRRRSYRPKAIPFDPRKPLNVSALNVQELNPYRADNRIKLAALVEQARFHKWDLAFLAGMHGTVGIATPGLPRHPSGSSAIAGSGRGTHSRIGHGADWGP